jgi:hypothetical protein
VYDLSQPFLPNLIFGRKARTYQSDDFKDRLLALSKSGKLRVKHLTRNKHPSLFVQRLSYKEKSFKTLTPGRPEPWHSNWPWPQERGTEKNSGILIC